MMYTQMDLRGLDENEYSVISSLTSTGRDCWHHGDGSAALKAFREAQEKADRSRSLEVSPVRSWCSFNTGTCLLGLGRARESIPLLKQALAGGRDLRMEPGLTGDELLRNAQLHYNLAMAQAAVGQHTEAVDQYKQALGAFKRLRRGEDEGGALLRLADSYRALEKYEPASKCYRRALELYEGSNNEGGMACVRSEWASLLLQLGQQQDVQEAERELELAVLLAEKISDKKTRGRVYCTVGSAYAGLHHHEIALVCLRKALQDIRSLPDTRQQEAAILQNIGGVYNLLECYQESLLFHQQALGLFESQSNTSALAVTLANLAFALASLGRLTEAEVMFHRAEQAATTVDDQDTLARVWEGLAGVYFRSQQTDQSVSLLKKSISSLSSVARDTTADIDRLVNKLSTVLSYQNKAKTLTRNPKKSQVVEEQKLAEQSLQLTPASFQATAVISNQSVSSSASSSSSSLAVLDLPEVSSLSSSEDERVGWKEADQGDSECSSHRTPGSSTATAEVHGAMAGEISKTKPKSATRVTPPPPKKDTAQGRRRAKHKLHTDTKPSISGQLGSASTQESTVAAESPPSSPTSTTHRRVANIDTDNSSPLMANLMMDVKSRRRQKAALKGFGTNTPTGLKLKQSALGASTPPPTPGSPADSIDGKTRSSVCVVL